MKNELNVKMLGTFEVAYNGTLIVDENTRRSKPIQLLQYLLTNRQQWVQQDELVQILLSGEDSSPINTLKNIVYRLRKILLAGGIAQECVKYSRGSYGLFFEGNMEIDTELFDEYNKKSQDIYEEKEQRLTYCLAALSLYRGSFLERSSTKPWSTWIAVRYQEKYIDCVKRAVTLAESKDQQRAVLEHLQKAVTLYPYEEDLYVPYIEALYGLNLVDEAHQEYDKIETRLMNEFGVGPTERMRELRKQITGGIQNVVENVADVRSQISEGHNEQPFFSSLETFSRIYQFMVRHMERSKSTAFLMLCTLTEKDGSPPKSGDRISKIAAVFHDAVKDSLRKGDAYTRYSPSQFLLMLMQLDEKSCEIVAERLRVNFYKNPGMDKVRLTCRSISAADMANLMRGEQGR